MTWDFDATPPAESNKKKIETGQCPRCKHLHHANLTTYGRCWFMIPRRSARLQDKRGKYRRCRCSHQDIGPLPGCPCPTCAGKLERGEPPEPSGEGYEEEHDEALLDEEMAQDGFRFRTFDRSKVRWGYWGGANTRQHGYLGKPDPKFDLMSTLCGLAGESARIAFNVSEETVAHCWTCRRVLARGTLWRAR